MENSTDTKSYKYLYLGIILLFLVFKFIELNLTFIVNADGPWSLSETLSMLKGDWGWSTFSHEPDGPIYDNYSYPILFYIPFKIFGVSHISYLCAYFFYIILAIVGIYKILEKYSFLQFLVSVIFVSSVYTYNFRYEVLAITLIIWGLFFLLKENNWKYLGLFLFAWAGLIHPATMVALVFVVWHYLYLTNRVFDFKTIGLYLIVTVFFTFLLLGFNIYNLLDPIFAATELEQRFGVIKPINIIKWLVLAGVFIWGLIITIKKTTWVSYLFIGLNVFVYLIFKKSYYYPYLLLHVFLLIYYNKDNLEFNIWFKRLFYAHLAGFWIVFFVFPVYKSIDNPDYGNMMRANVEYLKKYTKSMKPEERIYVERELIMGIANSKNARMYLSEYSLYYQGAPKIDLKSNDKIYLFKSKELKIFKKKMKSIIHQNKVYIKQIHAPVKGLLTFEGRGDSIGLWEISVK